MALDLGSLGKFYVGVGVDLNDLKNGMKNAVSVMENANRNIVSSSSRISESIGGISRSMAGLALGYAGIQGLSVAFENTAVAGFKYNAMLEQSEISFATMLGGADKAKKMLDDLQQFAAVTPFEFKDLQKNAKYMMAMGFQANELIPSLRKIGDAAAGLGLSGSEGIERIIRALGQMRMKGKVQAQEMMQLAEANIPAWQMLADSMGMTTAQVMDMSEKGLVPAEGAIKAIIDGMGAKFPDMMEKQSQSFNGLMSTVRDNLDMTFGKVMKPLFEDFTQNIMPDMVQSITDFSNAVSAGGFGAGLRTLIPENLQGIIVGLTGAWAAYKTVTLACSAATTAHAVAEAFRTGAVALSTKGTITGSLANIAATASTIAHTFAVGGLTAAYSALAAAMAANPIGLAFAAIVAVVAGVVYMIKYHWDDCRNTCIAIWNAMVDAWTTVLEMFLQTPLAVALITAFSAAWALLGEAVEYVTPYITEAINYINTKVAELSAWCSAKIADIKQFFSDLATSIATKLGDVGSTMTDMMNNILPDWAKEFIGWLDKIMAKAREFAKDVATSIRNSLHIKTDAEKAAEGGGGEEGGEDEPEPEPETPPTAVTHVKSGKSDTAFQAAKKLYDLDVSTFDYTQAEKLALYQQYLADIERTSDEEIEYKKSIYSMETAAAKENYDFQKVALDEFVLSNKGKLDEIYAKKIELANAELGLYREGTLAYQTALKARHQLDVEYAEAKRKVEEQAQEREKQAKLMAVDSENQQYQFLASIGAISNEEKLAADRRYIQEKYALERELAEFQMNNMLLSADERQKYADKITEIDRNMNKELTSNAQEMWKEQQKWQLTLIDDFTSSLQKVSADLLNFTTSWREAFAELGKSIVNSLIGSLTKAFTDKLKNKLTNKLLGGNKENEEEKKNNKKKLTDATATAAAISTMKAAAAQADILVARGAAKAAGAAGIAEANAVVGAIGAAFTACLGMLQAESDAIAAIPPSGPAMAAAMNAGITAATTALTAATTAATGTIGGVSKGLASFDVGSWSVPHDMVANIHKGEVIVPEPFANRARGLLTGDEPTQGGGLSQLNLTIHAVDAKSVKELFKKHGKEMGESLLGQKRKFAYAGM